jgi:hypothetical protein
VHSTSLAVQRVWTEPFLRLMQRTRVKRNILPPSQGSTIHRGTESVERLVNRPAATYNAIRGVARRNARNDLPHGQGRRNTLNVPPLNMAVVSDNAIRATTGHLTRDVADVYSTYRNPQPYRVGSDKRQCSLNYALRG